jgi:hypothetical protein
MPQLKWQIKQHHMAKIGIFMAKTGNKSLSESKPRYRAWVTNQ